MKINKIVTLLIAFIPTLTISMQELHDAIKAGDKARVQNLIQERKMHPNATDQEYKTPPLKMAIMLQQVDIALLLLTLGANPSTTRPDGYTPLFIINEHVPSPQDQATLRKALLQRGGELMFLKPVHQAQ